ncbi:uncharacterized protein LOC103507192 [Diaphorina citri]|uniref:Uncharacterized protein LOC103507192 n=1 Tax=Diaphorina citri TaxID=121845 RepID=A0A1S4E974_DIACI|nr:uncharacterized protein LOC103507192 [Diaphorina citri]
MKDAEHHIAHIVCYCASPCSSHSASFVSKFGRRRALTGRANNLRAHSRPHGKAARNVRRVSRPYGRHRLRSGHWIGGMSDAVPPTSVELFRHSPPGYVRPYCYCRVTRSRVHLRDNLRGGHLRHHLRLFPRQHLQLRVRDLSPASPAETPKWRGGEL